ncbi:MAG TPA: TonB-dependent receptor [Rhizomicrobium sp.]|nr:TonB-dependent receptor [Rhizomicrobium sp.]
MSNRCSFGTRRSLLLLNTLLLSGVVCSAACAQIEEVVVTAQKKSENIQAVPISITAYSAEDLTAHQIDQFKDLQFSTPSVTYSKGNFNGSDFSIRGIGQSTSFGDLEGGVATDINDVYLLDPLLAESTFHDLQRVEVLRGPQSTLYGRGATGGVVNLITNAPDLATGSVDLFSSYGNYNAVEIRGDANMPIETDQLALRFSGDWVRHDGYIDNEFNNTHIDSQDTYSVRASIRWEPTARTTVDFMAEYTRENDSRMRSTRQLCDRDSTAILGCLPTGAGDQPVNELAMTAFIESSSQALGNLGELINPSLAPYFAKMGLFSLENQPGTAGFNEPGNPFHVYSDFNPVYLAQDSFLNLNIKQNVTSWLDATFVGGYDRPSNFSQESYTNAPGFSLDSPQGIQTLETAVGTLQSLLGPAFAPYAPYFAGIGQGELPESQIKQLGIVSGNYNLTKDLTPYDQSNFGESQWSGEVRLNSKFDGPLNFMLAGYSLHANVSTDYYVASPMLDYPSILLGSFLGALYNPTQCAAGGCIQAPPFYHNQSFETLESNAVFGEAYYAAIPDTLNFTAGLRYTEDTKSEADRIVFQSVPAPVGTTELDNSIDAANAFHFLGLNYEPDCVYDANSVAPGCQDVANQSVTYRKVTGRFVADWTPKLDFTDSTLLYASYSRGYKAGGFNPGIEPGLTVPISYGPEQVNAYELGTKNTVLSKTVQANGDVWYYDYQGYQISTIQGNTTVNENINNAKLWGVEGEIFWAPADRWQFGLNLSHENSSIGDQMLLDTRNPTGGRSDALLIKDDNISAASGQNCVLYNSNPALNGGLTPGQLGIPGFLVPPGGAHALASAGIANANFGFCPFDAPAAITNALAAYGWSWSDPKGIGDSSGSPVNIGGNELENTPALQVNVSGQYTQPLASGYSLTGRVEYYWQSHMWGRVWEDPADRISSWDTMSALITLNSPDDRWYVQAFIRNIFNRSNVTGEYLTSSSSGLYTNAFQEDPRTYGIGVGVHM